MRGTEEVECVKTSFGLKQSYILPVCSISGHDPEETNQASANPILRLLQFCAPRQRCVASGGISSVALLAALSFCLILSCCGASFNVNAAASAKTGSISPSPGSVDFGTVGVGQAFNSVVSVANSGSAPVQLSQVTVSGAAFAFEGQASLPVTVAAGGTYDLKVQFNPNATGSTTGQLTIATDSTVTPTAMVKLKGTGGKTTSSTAPVTPNALTCTQASITGSGTDVCTVTLSAAAPSGGLSV